MRASVSLERAGDFSRAPLVSLLLAATSLFFAATSLGQSPTAVVNGQVRDASGAAIAGATIEVFNDATHVRYATETNAEGIYSIPSLPSGTYHIQVSKQGFKTVVHPDVTLNVQDAKAIGFTLPVGAISDTVTVEGGVTLVNTENAAVSTVVDQTYIKNMPLNGRSLQDLILLTPGIVTNSPQRSGANNVVSGLGGTGEFSVNGQRTESNYYTVDGVSANVGAVTGLSMALGGGASGSIAAATALGTTQALVSVDDLQEFRVESSTYSAEYGRNPGGQFAFETKSGTNQWHGTAYDYLRNNYFDANDWFNNYSAIKPAALRQNDFGGTLGGPVEIPRVYNGKDKTFFFASYEGLRLLQPQIPVATYVPDLCMRGSQAACATLNAQYAGTPAGAAIGYPNNGRQPAPSAVLPVLNAFPQPSANGLEDPVNGFNQFIGTWSNPSSLDSTSIRFEHVVNGKLKVFFRFSDTNSNSATRAVNGNAASESTTASYTLRTYTAGASSVFTYRLSNEFRLNYSSNLATRGNTIVAFGGSTPVNLGQLVGLPASPASPSFELFFGEGGGFSLFNQDGTQRQWNLIDTVSLSFGRHQFKFGVDYRRLAPFATPANPTVAFYYLGEGCVETNSAFTLADTVAPAYPLYTNYSAFTQDQWKASQRLSVSMGLRWDVNPAPGVTQGLMPYTLQGSSPNTFALAPQGTPLWKTAWYNFAPRLGAAYALRTAPGRETVVRVGGGLFYDSGQQLGSEGFNGPGFLQMGQFSAGTFPVLPPIPAITNPPASATNVYWFPQHLQLPYTLQWNASFEQALGKSQTLTASYVGSHGARLLKLERVNAPNNPNLTHFWAIESGLTSDYDSLQLQFRRRLSEGLTALGSYTFSHCLDYGSQNYQFGYQRGNCDFDVRDNFSGAFSYDFPNVGHNRFLNSVLHHWGMDDRFTARTGFPITLNGRVYVDPLTGDRLNGGLDWVQGQPVYLHGNNCTSTLQALGDLAPGTGCPGNWAINPQAFAAVPTNPARLGNAPRNFVRGLGAWQMDLAMRREFPIWENLKLQFRAEAFNVFNHPNFGSVNTAFCSSPGCTFGQVTATLGQSLGVLSPLYQMGGPRSMQLALRFTF